jgi:hypothetical protein
MQRSESAGVPRASPCLRQQLAFHRHVQRQSPIFFIMLTACLACVRDRCGLSPSHSIWSKTCVVSCDLVRSPTSLTARSGCRVRNRSRCGRFGHPGMSAQPPSPGARPPFGLGILVRGRRVVRNDPNIGLITRERRGPASRSHSVGVELNDARSRHPGTRRTLPRSLVRDGRRTVSGRGSPSVGSVHRTTSHPSGGVSRPAPCRFPDETLCEVLARHSIES